MPCFLRVEIQVDDESSARDTLRALGLPLSLLTKAGNKFRVDLTGKNVTEETFRTEYGRSFAKKKASLSGYYLKGETVGPDGKITMTFTDGGP